MKPAALLQGKSMTYGQTRRSRKIRRSSTSPIRQPGGCGVATAAMIMLMFSMPLPDCDSFGTTITPPTHAMADDWTRSRATGSLTAALQSTGRPGSRSSRDRWILKSSEAEKTTREEDLRQMEDNNWGMDDSIDVNAIRMKMMEQAGYELGGEVSAVEEWIASDAPEEVTDKIEDSFVEDLPEDTDISSFLNEEFEKGQSALKALAKELKIEQGNSSYAEMMAQEIAELILEEEEKADREIKAREGPARAKLEAEKDNLEMAVEDAQRARKAFEGDFILQLMSFRQKGVLRQAAFAASIVIANQAVYQAILVADDRGGSPAFAVGGLIVSAALVWVYGYRPF